MILRPALRPLTGPRPPGDFAARFFVAVIRPPLLFFAMVLDSFFFSSRLAIPASGPCDGIGVQSDRSLRQRPAEQRRAGLQRNLRLTQDDPLEGSRRSKDHLAEDLPEDVLRLCAAAQGDNGAVAHGKVLCNLEDPDI